MFNSICRVATPLCAFACLTACAPLLTLVGSSGTAIEVAIQFDRIKLLGDGISYIQSGKTMSDHVISRVAHADCKIGNILSMVPMCSHDGQIASPTAKDVMLAALLAWERPAPPLEAIELHAEDAPAPSVLAAVSGLPEY